MHKKKRFRIDGDTMTTIVVSSLLFCVVVVVAGMVLAWFGKDTSAIVASALTLFGTELGVCGLMTIFDRRNARLDKESEKREEKRRKEKENDISEKKEFINNLRGNNDDVAG